ncbi:unnamed protein product [Ectocarpus fasciculatus]
MTPRERGQGWQPTPLSSWTPFGVCRCRPRGCGSTPFRWGTRDSPPAGGTAARWTRSAPTRSRLHGVPDTALLVGRPEGDGPKVRPYEG